MILNKIMPTYGDNPPFDLRHLFAQATGFEVEDYFGLLFCTLTKCLQFNLDNLLRNPEMFALDSGFLAATKFSREQIECFLSDVSASSDDYRAALQRLNRGLFDFTCFKDRPLLRQGSKVYPIDSHFLGARCESALYWKVYDGLSGKDKEKFQAFWGDLFQRYINWLLAQSVDGKLNNFVPAPKFLGANEEICDALVLCGNSAVLLEHKGGLFAASAKYDGAPEVLRSDIEKKFVGTQDKRKGVLQLVHSIETLFSGPGRGIADLDISRVSKVYPVLVIHDDIGGAWCLNAYLNARFKTLLKNRSTRFANSTGSKLIVTPLFCISADHLEVIAGRLRAKALSEILETRYRRENALNLLFLLVENPSLGEDAFRIPEFLRKEMGEFVERLKETFAPVE